MKQTIIFFLLCCTIFSLVSSIKVDDDDDSDNAFEEERSKALHFLRRTIFHPTLTKCEEQKREAKEDYEERCEPSNPIYRNQGTQRNCPDLSAWDAFVNYEIGDGIDTLEAYKPNINIKLPKLPKLPSADEVSNRVYNKVTGLKKRAISSNNQ